MITWDDPTSTQKDFHDHTQNSYAYFLLSDEDMLTDHKPRTEVYPCTAKSIAYQIADYSCPWTLTCYNPTEEEVKALAKEASSTGQTYFTIIAERDLYKTTEDLKKWIMQGICENGYSPDFSIGKCNLQKRWNTFHTMYIVSFDSGDGMPKALPVIKTEAELHQLLDDAITANKRKITIYAPSQTLVSQFVNSYNKPGNYQIDGNSWYDFGGTYVKSYIQIRNMECESN